MGRQPRPRISKLFAGKLRCKCHKVTCRPRVWEKLCNQKKNRTINGIGVPPEEILAITFTRTSAADLRNEIATIESAGAEMVVARTLHSHAMQMLLRQEAQELLDRRPRIIIEHELSPAFRDIQIPDGHDVRQKKALVASLFLAGRLFSQISQDTQEIRMNKNLKMP